MRTSYLLVGLDVKHPLLRTLSQFVNCRRAADASSVLCSPTGAAQARSIPSVSIQGYDADCRMTTYKAGAAGVQ